MNHLIVRDPCPAASLIRADPSNILLAEQRVLSFAGPGQAQIWLADNYARDRALSAAIETSGLQGRTFNRRFRAATGYSPSEHLQNLRIEEAKQLLESTPTGIGDIANAVGYSDEASFRRQFRGLVGLSPAGYRRRYAFPDLAGVA